MTLKEVRSEIAKKYGYDNWKFFLRHTSLYNDIIKAEDECMVLYAKYMCGEQRYICDMENINGKSIINAPFPDFE